MVGIIIKDGVVKGGTIAEIVHYLIDQNAVPNSPDRTSLEHFLAAFPEVTTTMDVWNALVEKFNTSPPLGQLRRNSMEQPRKEPRDKVLEFLWIWIEQEVSRDFILKKKQTIDERASQISSELWQRLGKQNQTSRCKEWTKEIDDS